MRRWQRPSVHYAPDLISDHMLEITSYEVTTKILSLFDITKPTMPRAFNVLDGTMCGQILIDDASHPEWAVFRDGVYGTLYFGGQINKSLLETLVTHFRQIGEVGIGCWLDDLLNEMIPYQPDYDGFTLYFAERSKRVLLKPLLNHIPEGIRLAHRDEQLFKKSFDYESTLVAFGSVEYVMKHTLGVMLLEGDTLICEAATGAPTHGHIEVGVTTAESYRQRGFAAMACASLIRECEERGYFTWWDCAKQNVASARLAKKLGYENGREYRYAWWAKS